MKYWRGYILKLLRRMKEAKRILEEVQQDASICEDSEYQEKAK